MTFDPFQVEAGSDTPATSASPTATCLVVSVEANLPLSILLLTNKILCSVGSCPMIFDVVNGG